MTYTSPNSPVDSTDAPAAESTSPRTFIQNDLLEESREVSIENEEIEISQSDAEMGAEEGPVQDSGIGHSESDASDESSSRYSQMTLLQNATMLEGTTEELTEDSVQSGVPNLARVEEESADTREDTTGSAPEAPTPVPAPTKPKSSLRPPKSALKTSEPRIAQQKIVSQTERSEPLHTPQSLNQTHPPQLFRHSESLARAVVAQCHALSRKYASSDSEQFGFELHTRYRFIQVPNAKETIVCIHGLMASMHMWDIFACEALNNQDIVRLTSSRSIVTFEDEYTDTHDDFSSNDKSSSEPHKYNILMYDNFNAGGSSQIPQPVPQLLVQQLIELLQHLKLWITPNDNTSKETPVHNLIVMGHSMGGAIAMHFANQNPLRISKLILCCLGGLLKSVPHFVKYAQMPVVSSLIFGGMKMAFSYKPLVDRGFYGSQNKDFLTSILQEDMPPDRVVHTMRSTMKYFPIQGCEYLIDWLCNFQDESSANHQFDVLVAWGVYDHDAPVDEIFPYLEEKLRYMNTSFALFDNTRHSFVVERATDFAKVVMHFLNGGSILGVKDHLDGYDPAGVKPSSKDKRVRKMLEKKYASYLV